MGEARRAPYASKSAPVAVDTDANGLSKNFLNKPDGGRGWTSWFLDQGYEVYVVDLTTTARSPWLLDSGFSETVFTAEFIAQRFTAVQNFPLWPQAKLHTQWPDVSPAIACTRFPRMIY
jgi:hypothetical protein